MVNPAHALAVSTARATTAADGDAAASPLSSLVERFPSPAVLLDAEGRVVERNRSGEDLALAVGDEAGLPLRQMAVRAAASGTAVQERLTLAGDDGDALFEIVFVPVAGGQGHTLLLARDITYVSNMNKALLASRTLFRDLVMCSADLAWEADTEGRFSFVSPKGALGYAAAELSGQPARQILLAEGETDVFSAAKPLTDVEVHARRKDGSAAVFKVSAVPVIENGVRVASRGVCHDITEAREREAALAQAHETLRNLSRTDELTGLLNRRAFSQSVVRRMEHERRHGRVCALLYLDLDGFKPINDRFGHHKGDEVLRLFAEQIKTDCRTGDLAARLGGDEFALWLQDTGRDGAIAKVMNVLSECGLIPDEAGVGEIPFGVSVGIAVTEPAVDETFEMLIKRADAAMYEAKRQGKNGFAVASAPQATDR